MNKTTISIVMCIAAIAITLSSFAQKKYYFAANGNDGSAGDSLRPFKSLTKLNSLSTTDQDKIFLHGGDYFFGQIKPTGRAGITSYGNGRATITGFKHVTEWISIGGNLYESAGTVSSATYLNLVVMGGKPQHKGRYPDVDAPNGGYLNFESHYGKISITDNELPASVSVVGGNEIVFRTNQWVTDRNIVSRRSGNTVYSTGITYEPINKFGYFLQNGKQFCNQNGEWYYNSATRKLIVYSSTGAPQDVKVAAVENLLNTNFKKGITVDNVNFEGSNGDAIIVNYPEFKIQNSEINFAGNHGILTTNYAQGFRYDNVNIRYALNIGIETNTNELYIGNFKIFDTYPLEGHGQNGEGMRGSAITLRALDNGAVVEHGEIRRTGGNGIAFKNRDTSSRSNNILLYDIVLGDILLLKSDQSAIYTHVGESNHPRYYNRVIRKVSVTNVIGNNLGTDRPFRASYAYYGDHGATDVWIDSCKFLYASRAGVFINYGSGRTKVTNSIIAFNGDGMGADTRGTQIYINEREDDLIRGCEFTNNKILSKNQRKLVYVDNSFGTSTANFGIMNNNLYEIPEAYKAYAFVTRTRADILRHNIEDWRQRFGYDINSTLRLPTTYEPTPLPEPVPPPDTIPPTPTPTPTGIILSSDVLSYNAPATFIIKGVTSADISYMQFLMNGRHFYMDNDKPFQTRFSNAPAGRYVFTAKSKDSAGNTISSTSLTITVR